MEQSPWYYLVDEEELEQLIIDVFYLPKEGNLSYGYAI